MEAFCFKKQNDDIPSGESGVCERRQVQYTDSVLYLAHNRWEGNGVFIDGVSN